MANRSAVGVLRSGMAAGWRVLLAATCALRVVGAPVDVVLIPESGPWRLHKGTGEASLPDPGQWRFPGYPTAEWPVHPAPLQFGRSGAATPLADMQRREGQVGYTGFHLVRELVLDHPRDFQRLELRVRCDDGFVAWLNGSEIARYQAPDFGPYYNSVATAAAPDPLALLTFAIEKPASLLEVGTNVLAVQVLNVAAEDPDVLWTASLVGQPDVEPPRIVSILPTPGRTLRRLLAVEVEFSEPVDGLDAGDLTFNGLPAASVREVAPGQFEFVVPDITEGPVSVAWRDGHDITDQTAAGNPFTGADWSYSIDPTALPQGLVISELLADNQRGIRDEDGDEVDWIELFNGDEEEVDLEGWSLSDDSRNPGAWRFPAVVIEPGEFLVVYASGKDRSVAGGPLHAGFRLSAGGEFLGLFAPDGREVSAFSPAFPALSADQSYGRAPGDPSSAGYMERPTPGAANSASGSGFASPVAFSEPGRTYLGTLTVTLSASESHAGQSIHYTLDHSLPTTNSPVYTGPLELTGAVDLRARAFAPGLLPGPAASENYFQIDGAMAAVRSDLPILILNNYGARRPTTVLSRFAAYQLFDTNGSGFSSFLEPPTVSGRSVIASRGSSTEGMPKVSLKWELQDEYGLDRDLEVLGMPADSDWVLYAPNSFEPIMIHNPLMHRLSRDMGRYSPRTRFVEVYLMTTGTGAIGTASYAGIYVLEEKIKRGRDRVAVAKLEPEHVAEPAVTGGYLFKIDRPDPGDAGFSAGGTTVLHVEPKERELRQPARLPQRTYVLNYFQSFIRALYSTGWQDPETGYAPFVDVPSWIDFHLLNTFAFNVDALRLSTYFHKPREGPIVFGPLWDFDRALGSTDGRDINPKVWSGGGGTDFFRYPWWDRLFRDPEFYQRWIDRYSEVREGVLSRSNVFGLIDEMTGQLRRAQPREQARWRPPYRGGTFDSEIVWTKNWISNRLEFMDLQFVPAPRIHVGDGDPEAARKTVTLEGPPGAEVWYTLDGSDPRLPGGAVSPVARAAVPGEPVWLDRNTRVTARCMNPGFRPPRSGLPPPLVSVWSGRRETLVLTDPEPLIITEIHFHPADPPPGSLRASSDFEFIEIKNRGRRTVELDGYRISGGIDHLFTAAGPVVRLEPGERLLLVADPAAFRERYPDAGPVAGAYAGRLANDSNRILLEGPLGEVVTTVRYRDHWEPPADGEGYSLVVASESLRPDAVDSPDAWRTSAVAGGSPGRPDPVSDVAPDTDLDEDLLPDAWETRFGLDARRGEGADGGGGDPDLDGVTNRDEFLAGTNPRDPTSVLSLVVDRDAGGVRLRFPRQPGRRYRWWGSRTLGAVSDWQLLGEIPSSTGSGPVERIETPGDDLGYFRVTTP